MRGWLVLPAALTLAACSSGDADPAEGAGGWHIAPGIYGNVRHDAETGHDEGFEVELAKGSEGETVDFVRCDERCGPVSTLPIRRGLNGISFTIEGAGAPVDVAIQPGGPKGVEISADWGKGVESRYLPRIERKRGLAAPDGGAAQP